jgi:hypothetical protein
MRKRYRVSSLKLPTVQLFLSNHTPELKPLKDIFGDLGQLSHLDN